MHINIKHLFMAVAAGYGLFASSAQACKLSVPLKQNATPMAVIPAAPAANPANSASDDNDDRRHPHNPAIVGMWLSEFIGQEGTDLAFDSFYADGNELLVDQSDPRTDNVCTGVWEQTGPRTYTVNHPSWDFDTNGNLVAIVVFIETITLDRKGNSFTGTETITAYDPSDLTLTTILGQSSGTLKGTRITANSQPL
jgi:hypothetical protein